MPAHASRGRPPARRRRAAPGPRGRGGARGRPDDAVRVGYDDRLFAGPRPRTPGSPTTSPTTWSRRSPRSGWTRGATPTASAGWPTRRRPPAGVFARALAAQGIRVLGAARSGAGRRGRTRRSPRSHSAPLDQIVERVLEVSDNEARGGARPPRRPRGGRGGARSPGACAASRRRCGALGVPLAGAQLHDGSGLSREQPADRADAGGTCCDWPPTADRPELRAVLTGLPVAGFTGSLTLPVRRRPPRRAWAWCAPRPGRSPGCPVSPGWSPTGTAPPWSSCWSPTGSGSRTPWTPARRWTGWPRRSPRCRCGG